jgi:Zn-dependent protease with chaperone function
MKIYIQNNGQTLGPFSKEEVRHKIYSGELARTVSARSDDLQEWQPLDLLLSRDEPGISPAPPSVTVDLNQLRDPKEKTALIWLYIASVPMWALILFFIISTKGTVLFTVGFIAVFIMFGELWFAAHLKANAVRVSETQLPELYAEVRSGCEKLGMALPDVYVMQHNVWNAYAAKIFGRRMVVLFSGAVDSILLKGDMRQLSWVVGHELGHHWAGHLGWKQKLASLGGWLIWVSLWHSRRRELTCDRVGLYCAGSLRSSQFALANLTVGAQLASKVDMASATAQWQEVNREFFVRYRTFYSHYPHLLARLDHLNRAGQEFGMGQ